MITHPAPWVKWNSGGYLSQRDEVIRVDFNPEHRRLIMAADKKHLLDTILKALDVLGSTPWKINTRVLDIVLQFWERGIDAPHLPAKYNVPPPIKPNSNVKDAVLSKKYNSELRKYQQNIQNNFSQRCDVHYKIEVAKAVSIKATKNSFNMKSSIFLITWILGEEHILCRLI
jgi:DNA-directed RNA polymerase